MGKKVVMGWGIFSASGKLMGVKLQLNPMTWYADVRPVEIREVSKGKKK